MTVGPWSVKGIDPKAREVAKDLARRSGMTLGEWLNQMIIEGDADGAVPAEAPRPSYAALADAPRRSAEAPDVERIARALETLSARVEAAEHRSTLAISGIDQSVNGVVARFGAMERGNADVAARVDMALEETRRTETELREELRLAREAGPSLEAVSRLETLLGDLQGDISHTARRVDRAEAQVERLASEGYAEALARIAARLDGAESASGDAVRALQSSVAGLEERMRTAEDREGSARSGLEHRLAELSAELAGKIDASRRELAERLHEAAGGGVEEAEARLQALGAQVEASERRSAEAIETMGREVLKVASALGERVRQAEARTALTAQQAGEQMNRIAGAIDQRLGVQEAAQAEALERLGGEIARIAEKLTDRILSADRRSAQAIDDVGDQLGRVTERLNQRFERQESELGERIRLSEERTAKLLEEAQGHLDARFSEIKRRSALEAQAEAARKAAEADLERAALDEPDGHAVGPPPPRLDAPAPAEPALDAGPFGRAPDLASEETLEPRFGAPPPRADLPPVIDASVAHDEHAVFGRSGPLPAPPPFADLDEPLEDLGAEPPFVAARGAETARPGLGREAPSRGEDPEALTLAADPATAHRPAAPLSTRDMIEQARAAARRAAEPAQPRRGERGAVEAPPLEQEGSGFSFPFARRKKKEGVALRTALLASGTAAALAVTAVGAVSLVNSEMTTANNERSGAAPTAAQPDEAVAARRTGDAPPQSMTAPAGPPTAAAGAQGAQGAAAGDQVALALTAPPPVEAPLTRGAEQRPAAPAPAPPPASSSAAEAVDSGVSRSLYSSAVRRIEGGDVSGTEDLKRAANLGYAPAEFYLAQLLEKGSGGLPRDLAAARRWTERAAMGGETAAMHNLAMYFYEGEGGPQDSGQALKWFSRAAEEGVRDSQYNLALLYAQGLGTPQNLAEAYKWYLVAAAQGDVGARDAAKALRAQLTPETQAAAERSAAAFHARARNVVRTAMATPEGR